MTLRERATKVARSVFGALGVTPDDEQSKTATDVIEQAIIDVVLEERGRCAKVVTASFGTPDADKAHKIAEDIRRAEDAMIAGRAANQR